MSITSCHHSQISRGLRKERATSHKHCPPRPCLSCLRPDKASNIQLMDYSNAFHQCHITNANQPSPWPFSTSQYKSTLFETKMACIENIAKMQHRQLNYQSHTCHNCDILIKTFDLRWLKRSEVPQNPASIPSASSVAREWLVEAIIGHSILTQSGWWAGGQGFQTGTAGWLCYQGQCQILQARESMTWTLLVVIRCCSLLTDWARPSDS